ncbi:helix-turn-helix domain-containing protein [Burkholderia sp. MR1-5-21]
MRFPIQTLSQLRPILVGFRKSAGLTQARLAARLGITQQSYAKLEADPTAVSVERLFKVLQMLGVDLTLGQATSDAIASPSAERTGVDAAADATATSNDSSRKQAAALRAYKTAHGGPKIAVEAREAVPTSTKAAKQPARRVTKREDW